MLDSAAAKECYDAAEAEDTVQDQNMVHPAWKDYPRPLRASEWHQCAWLNGDLRATLTWKNRLRNVIENGGLTNVYNFYSSGEEVLNNPDTGNPALDSGNPFSNGLLPWLKANKIWGMQEKRKGLGITGYIHTSNYGGWAPNLFPFDPSIHMALPDDNWRMAFPAALPQSPDGSYFEFLASLTQRPFFDTSQHAILFDPDLGLDSPGSQYAKAHRNTLISQMIPCTTFTAGRNAFINILKDDPNTPEDEERNIDMDATMKTDPNEWPLTDEHKENDDDPPIRAWLHSDIREKAFTHNWKIFKKFVELGNLNESN